MFQEFPYTDMHQLNLDWIIKIAKDFLDQYTHIQELISNGEESLQNLTTEGLQQLQDKADNLEELLQQWYNTHSNDIADQLADALADLNEWYNSHTGYLNDLLLENQRLFQEYADQVIATIPQDYTILSNQHERAYAGVENYDLSTMQTLENTYIDANGDPQTAAGYNTYKIPAKSGDIFIIEYDTIAPFWNTLNPNYAIGWETDTYEHATPHSSAVESPSPYYFFNTDTNKILIYCISATVVNIFITADADRYNQIKVSKNFNTPSIKWERILNKESFICDLKDIGIKSQFFMNNTNGHVYVIENDWCTFTIPVKKNDIVYFDNPTITGLSYRGTFKKLSDNNVTRIPQNYYRYDIPDDGFISVFEEINNIGTVHINTTKSNPYYIDSLKIMSELSGYDCVAFGTSLTYRSISYRPVLADIMKLNIDNQGLGNGTIVEMTGHPNILQQIRNYTGTGKELIIIEGFVNDWYSGSPLGVYTDSGSTTACGALRTALNHFQTNRPNSEVVVIFDHYGRLYSTVDCSPSAINPNGVTQMEYYNEMAKVCETMGIPHIDLYKIARTSNSACLQDDIHPTEFGAKRLAYLIRQKLLEFQYPLA